MPKRPCDIEELRILTPIFDAAGSQNRAEYDRLMALLKENHFPLWEEWDGLYKDTEKIRRALLECSHVLLTPDAQAVRRKARSMGFGKPRRK